ERVLSTRIFDSSESSANKITIAGSVWASRSSSDSVEYEMTGRDSKAPMLILMHSHRNSRLSMTATKPPGLPRRPHSLIPSPILRGRDSTFAQDTATEASELLMRFPSLACGFRSLAALTRGSRAFTNLHARVYGQNHAVQCSNSYAATTRAPGR